MFCTDVHLTAKTGKESWHGIANYYKKTTYATIFFRSS